MLLCGDKEEDMTKYLETYRKALEEGGCQSTEYPVHGLFLRTERPTGNRPQVKILGEEVERVTHLKYIGTSLEEEGGMQRRRYSDTSWSSVEELEEMQWGVVR